jgi:hypothetical protein
MKIVTNEGTPSPSPVLPEQGVTFDLRIGWRSLQFVGSNESFRAIRPVLYARIALEVIWRLGVLVLFSAVAASGGVSAAVSAIRRALPFL